MKRKIREVLKKKYVAAGLIMSIVAGIVGITNFAVNADANAGIKYRAHVAYDGWLNWSADGQTAGTTGESKRMEAIKIKLTGDAKGDVIYSAFVKDTGWTAEVKNSATAGSEGQSKQIEALKVRLEGEVATKYDVAYRAHIKNGGWQDWVANGQVAGSETFGLRIEAIEIKLVEKKIETGVITGDTTEGSEQDAQVEQQPAQEEQPPVEQVPADQPVVEEQQPVQEQPPVEQPPVEEQQPEQPPVEQVSDSPFHKYTDLTETQLKGLARLCQQEQGTARGAAAEASLMANHMDLRHCNARKYEINGNGLYNYVRYGKWFAHAAKWMDKQDPRPEILEAVRKVLVEGKRTIPGYVNEHDCFSDISSATNNGSGISKKDRSAYKQHVTYIKNAYGGNYTFYCFPSDTSDPFGYTSKAKREEIGDFCYNFDDI